MSYKMDHEVQTVVKLKLAEQSLAAMLQKIDKEINQTEVEWMHLKSLIKPKNSFETKTEGNQLKESFQPQKALKMERHIDDEAVNEIQLDFSLGNLNTHAQSLEEEDDSD